MTTSIVLDRHLDNIGRFVIRHGAREARDGIDAVCVMMLAVGKEITNFFNSWHLT